MVGAKIPVLEIEKLRLTEDGRGLIVYNDGTNCRLGAWSTGYTPSNQSCLGWLKIHYVSGSTYGPTGAAGYIPIYSRTG